MIFPQYPVEEMDPSEIDWETINSQLPYEHSEEAHAQRRFNKIDIL